MQSRDITSAAGLVALLLFMPAGARAADAAPTPWSDEEFNRSAPFVNRWFAVEREMPTGLGACEQGVHLRGASFTALANGRDYCAQARPFDDSVSASYGAVGKPIRFAGHLGAATKDSGSEAGTMLRVSLPGGRSASLRMSSRDDDYGGWFATLELELRNHRGEVLGEKATGELPFDTDPRWSQMTLDSRHVAIVCELGHHASTSSSSVLWVLAKDGTMRKPEVLESSWTEPEEGGEPGSEIRSELTRVRGRPALRVRKADGKAQVRFWNGKDFR